jgi:hypothetical protein
MANSRSESPSRNAKGKRAMPGPGKKVVLNVVRGFSLVPEHKESTTLKGRTTGM